MHAAAPSAWAPPPPLTTTTDVPAHLLSRLLYTNPVCLLVAEVPVDGEAAPPKPRTARWTAMTISWLSALNNTGMCTLSMNERRFTASLPAVQPGGAFTLSVPVAGMEPLVRQIGKSSGRTVDKLAAIDLCAPGWGHFPPPCAADVEPPQKRTRTKRELKRMDRERAFAALAQSTAAVRDCVAHMVLRVLSVQSVSGHRLMVCQVEFGFVRDEWWRDGKLFTASDAALPSPLTFFGSGVFGEMRMLPA